jgi:hypothetical protein
VLTSHPYIQRVIAYNLKIVTPFCIPADNAAGEIMLDTPHRPNALVTEENAGMNKITREFVSTSEKNVQFYQTILSKKRPEISGTGRALKSIEGKIKASQDRRERLAQPGLRPT